MLLQKGPRKLSAHTLTSRRCDSKGVLVNAGWIVLPAPQLARHKISKMLHLASNSGFHRHKQTQADTKANSQGAFCAGQLNPNITTNECENQDTPALPKGFPTSKSSSMYCASQHRL
jgi:hypothetical protein